MISKENMEQLWHWASWVNTIGHEKAQELMELICDGLPDTPEEIELAEQLGSEFKKTYDSYQATGLTEFESPEIRLEYSNLLWNFYDKFLALHRREVKYREQLSSVQAQDDQS